MSFREENGRRHGQKMEAGFHLLTDSFIKIEAIPAKSAPMTAALTRRIAVEFGVSQQNLDHPDIDVLFEEVGGEAVPERMGRDALGDLGHVGGRMAGRLRRQEIIKLAPWLTLSARS